MSRRQDIETRLKDVLDCVAQIHRREASARSQAQNVLAELERIAHPAPGDENSPSVARIRHALTRWLRGGRAPSPAGRRPANRSAELGVVSFHGRSATSVPLTLEPQYVRLPRGEAVTDVWATPLTASDRARPALELQIARGQAQAPDTGTATQAIRLLPFRPHQLIAIEPGAGHLLVRLARTEGNFCILKLELVERGSAREAELQAAAAAAPQQVARNDDANQEKEPASAQSGNAAVPAVAALDQQLWGGYSAVALPALERLRLDPARLPKDRANAAWSLMRWHFAAGDYPAALAQIRYASSLLPAPLPRFALAEARCLLQLGRCDEAVEFLGSAPAGFADCDRWLLESVALRRATLRSGGDAGAAESLQLDRINRVLGAAGLAPIGKIDPARPLSPANITARAQPDCATQTRKVSVVMPAFNARETIAWALGSLLAQTWENLEVIVVDDASEDDTADRVADIAGRDARVRLIRLDSNKGSYFARNAGARLATGDLLLVHDADDWSHPQYLERQIALLDSYPSALAVKSYWVRVNERLEVLGTWMPRDSIVELNFSSLMFRRDLLETLGDWDAVRVAGDAEFYARFRAVFGEHSVVTAPKSCPLAFSLAREDSLTRTAATHLSSMYHGIRRNYMDAYRWWHGSLAAGNDLPFSGVSGKRPFPRPIGNASESLGDARFDLIVVADYAQPCTAFDNALSAIAAAARNGRRVAALHWRHFELNNRAALRSEFYRTCLEHDVSILSAGDSVGADLVVIVSPALLARIARPNATIDAADVIVLVDAGVAPAGISWREHGSPYDARHNATEVFGSEGRWLPTSEAAAKLMHEDRRYPAPSPGYWQPLVDGTALGARPIRWRGGERERPVIGRRIAGELDWPSRRADLDLAYGAAAAWDVRFHSDSTQFAAQLRDAPAHWQLVPRRSAGGIEFCRDLDFYVHFPHELHAGELGQGLLDAMALGIPVIVPHCYQPQLGSAASYAAPEDVAATVARLWVSERAYLERAAAGRAYVLDRFGTEDFPRRLHRAGAGERTVVQFGRGSAVRTAS